MLRKGSVLNEHFSSSGPKEGRSQKLGQFSFCSDTPFKPSLVNLSVPWTPLFLGYQSGSGGLGRDL